jgi:carboxyl-terminal processing protease
VTLLEQAHYNRDAVHSGDYAQVIPEYMKALDGQHLFFLDSDRAQFANRYGKNVYYNVDYLGKIDAAYDIFYTYDDRVTARIAWIFGELKNNIDFTAPDTSGSTARSRPGPPRAPRPTTSGGSASSSRCWPSS